jgi:hypothetical protein
MKVSNKFCVAKIANSPTSILISRCRFSVFSQQFDCQLFDLKILTKKAVWICHCAPEGGFLANPNGLCCAVSA